MGLQGWLQPPRSPTNKAQRQPPERRQLSRTSAMATAARLTSPRLPPYGPTHPPPFCHHLPQMAAVLLTGNGGLAGWGVMGRGQALAPQLCTTGGATLTHRSLLALISTPGPPYTTP